MTPHSIMMISLTVMALLCILLAYEWRKEPGRGWLHLILASLLLLLFGLSVHPARAHDHDHPELDGWYQSLMQPDNPSIPCCGKADAYWCDDYYARGDKAYCKVTDDRIVPGRPSIPVGTEVEIPAHKLKFDRANPTGHAIAFITRSLYVLCFVQGTGI